MMWRPLWIKVKTRSDLIDLNFQDYNSVTFKTQQTQQACINLSYYTTQSWRLSVWFLGIWNNCLATESQLSDVSWWSPFWKTSRSILLAQFVSISTTNPRLSHVFTHFASSVWQIMQERATADMGNSDAQSVRRKSIYPKEITSTDCRAVFSTTVCWVCLPCDGVVRETA